MSGFIQNWYIKDAINLFCQMQAANTELGAQNLRCMLDVYTHLGALQLCKSIYGYFIRNLFYISMEETRHLETSILNLFIICRNISSARVCFNNLDNNGCRLWNSGAWSQSYKTFGLMLEERIKPNSATLLVREGCEVFKNS